MIHSHWRQMILALIVCVPLIGYPVWCLLDREPPYVRDAGVIVPVDPKDCGLADAPIPGNILPGGCVSVEWTIRPLRRCPPSTLNNITRKIRDSGGVMWSIGPVEGFIGTANTPPKELTRYFLLPPGIRPGLAVYQSSASFACNPLQHYLPSLFWPVIVSVPDVEFEIASPPDKRAVVRERGRIPPQ